MFTLALKMFSVMNAPAGGNDPPLLRTPFSTKDAFSPLQANFLLTSSSSTIFLFFFLLLIFYSSTSYSCASTPGTISKANNNTPRLSTDPPPTNFAVTSARVSRASVWCADNCLCLAAMNHQPRWAPTPFPPPPAPPIDRFQAESFEFSGATSRDHEKQVTGRH